MDWSPNEQKPTKEIVLENNTSWSLGRLGSSTTNPPHRLTSIEARVAKSEGMVELSWTEDS